MKRTPLSTPQVSIWYAIPLVDFDRGSRRIVLIAVGCSLFWVASSCIIAWFSVTNGMVPLVELARQASAVSERSWALSLPPDVRNISETRSLALALEALVARLSAAFQRERTFVNDAAHELKTVVAIQNLHCRLHCRGMKPPLNTGLAWNGHLKMSTASMRWFIECFLWHRSKAPTARKKAIGCPWRKRYLRPAISSLRSPRLTALRSRRNSPGVTLSRAKRVFSRPPG